MNGIFPGKIGLQQRVLAAYRVPFFEQLGTKCSDGLEIFAGEPRPEEHIVTGGRMDVATHIEARNVHVGRGGFYFCWQRGYRRWLKRFNPDVLIVAADPRIVSTYLAIRYMHSRGRPVIGWGLGTLTQRPSRMSVASGLRSKLYRSYDAVVAYSSKAAEDYSRVGVPDDRIFVAQNAASMESANAAVVRYPADGEEVRKWRASHGLTRPTIIFVGRLIPQKRLDLLIESCRVTANDFDLLVVGDGPERKNLEQLAADRFPNIRFIGHQQGEELSLAFAASDLFVLPGTGGLAIHEAMAHRKPVIVGVGDGTEVDLVQDGRNGLLVPHVDLGSLTKAIQGYIGNPERLRKEGIESRKIVEEEANIEKMTSTFMSALRLVSGLDS
jgi:glycosyltransferase involved in cell wall biosynthesis